MPRKMPHINPLAIRKGLLIAESEINRANAMEEWVTMKSGVHALAGRVKTVSALASAAGILMAGVAAFKRSRSVASGPGHSWFRTALNGVRMAGSLWFALRAQK
ncbi:MAG: hypothetical protein JWM16_1152 [Verrucomicrobiales bacterium]|nr:hypothetical protein [Verrucomicrobiales bacterium]